MKGVMRLAGLLACGAALGGCGGRATTPARAGVAAELVGDLPAGDTFPAVFLGEQDGSLQFTHDHGFPGIGLPSTAVSVPLSKPMTVRRFGVETTYRSLVPGDRVELTLRDSRRVLVDVPDVAARVGSAAGAESR